ncbi:hypothetical protein A3C17_01225 [Candidatus Uhrbacteria bacterium RIFCSPHIGHO2_02_FULL_53_13]|uniref:Primosomal protein N' 3' DNA-binding domain-containing protein n=1 Tax=Candidatus Uhrbacteria bacterium RIFCSPHIGHO2_02_FULL_53_13 TaxID=1802389 RepID=A0A1F7TYW1_9BACT|nr:MAG: hypothetical protein A3C17_01225 [Candidatus Uhrbacteria bacterium RIFCSPHIGHO2_02_FULL_53_13]
MKGMFPIAHVAIVRRFPRTKGVFDYAIPEGLAVQAGSFVRVPFGKRVLDGVILSLSKHTLAKSLKLVAHVYDDPPLSKNDLEFYRALSKHTYQSLASIFHAAIPERPKRAHAYTHTDVGHAPLRIRKDYIASIQKAVKFLDTTTYADIAVLSDTVSEAIVVSALQTHEGPVRIVCPDYATLERMHRVLSHRRVMRYIANQPKTEHWDTYVHARFGTHDVLLTMRIGMLVPPPEGVTTFVVQSSSRDFRQDDQNPHYDTTWCLQYFKKQRNASVYSFDVLPRIEDRPVNLDLWRPAQLRILVDLSHSLHKYGLSETLVSAIERISPTKLFVVYHNRLGVSRLMTCKTCDFRWMCALCHRPYRVEESGFVCRTCHITQELPTACLNCHGNDLSSKGLGLKRLAQRLKNQFPDRNVEAIQAGNPLPNYGIAVVTETVWYQPIPPSLSGIAIVSLEHLFTHTGFDSQFHAYRTVRRLCGIASDRQIPIIIQAWDASLLSEAMQPTRVLVEHEQAIRKTLGYPPFMTHVTVRNTKAGDKKIYRFPLEHVDETLSQLPPIFDINVR